MTEPLDDDEKKKRKLRLVTDGDGDEPEDDDDEYQNLDELEKTIRLQFENNFEELKAVESLEGQAFVEKILEGIEPNLQLTEYLESIANNISLSEAETKKLISEMTSGTLEERKNAQQKLLEGDAKTHAYFAKLYTTGGDGVEMLQQINRMKDLCDPRMFMEPKHFRERLISEMDEFLTKPSPSSTHELLREDIMAVMADLSPREQSLLELRFGLKDGVTRTLEEVGQIFGVTREQIRQLEAKALRKLRHPNRSRRRNTCTPESKGEKNSLWFTDKSWEELLGVLSNFRSKDR